MLITAMLAPSTAPNAPIPGEAQPAGTGHERRREVRRPGDHHVDGPRRGPRVQVPAVAMPLLPVVARSDVSEPPPQSTVNVTTTPAM